MTRFITAIIFAVALVGFGGAALAQDETPTEFVCDPAVYGASVCDDEVEAMLTATAAVTNCPSGETTEDGTCVVYDPPEAFATTPEPTPDGGPIEGGPVTTPEPLWEKTCDDFASQQDAQFLYNDGALDPAKVDPDGDGMACEPDGVGFEDTAIWLCPYFDGDYNAAQATLDAGRGDTSELDLDGNGIACDEGGAFRDNPAGQDGGGAAYVDASTDAGEADAATVDEVVTNEPAADQPIATEPATDDGSASVEASTDDDATSGGTESLTLPKTGVGYASGADKAFLLVLTAATVFSGVAVWMFRRKAR